MIRKSKSSRKLESKTPDGVKIGVGQLVIPLVFCMLISPLLADCNSETQQDLCNCAGWYYAPGNDGGCKECDADSYCENGTKHTCTSTTPEYPKSKQGASSADHCYRDIACAGENDAVPGENSNARLYANGCIEYGNNDSHCFDNPQNSTSDYHMESTGCYSNTRACHLFYYRKASETPLVSHSTSESRDVTITGTAQWNSGYWRVRLCYKKENGETILNANCTGVTIAQASNDNNTVNNVTKVTDVLVYYDSPQLQNNNTNCPSCWQYRCTSCLAGHQFNRNVQGQYSSCQGDDVIICDCAETAEGYYSTGGSFCNYTFDQDIFNGNNFADNFCRPLIPENYVQSCPGPGMTSDVGATSSVQCHYGSGDAGTQFCDAFGCVYLDNLSFDTNNNTYTWDGDVHLVGVLFDENADYICPVYPNPPHFWGYDKDGNPIDAHGDIVNNCRRN